MVEVEHLVLGRGFMGCAVYKALKSDNKLMLYADKPEGASKSAAGIITESWYTAGTIRNQYAYPFTINMVKQGIQWLSFNGCNLLPQDEVRVNEMSGSRKTSKDTWLLWNKDDYLDSVDNKQIGNITSIDFVNKIVVTEDQSYRAENLHVCLGIGLLEFTEDIPIKGRVGEAIFYSDNNTELTTYYVAPYTHFTSRPWAKGIKRLGDTTKPNHLELLKKRLGENTIEVTSGVRPSPIHKGYVFHKYKNSYIYTSGGRVGLALSGMVGAYFKDLHNGELRF